ncbi:putative FMRFamide-like neuropeptide [Trichinella pseudospiralis]
MSASYQSKYTEKHTSSSLALQLNNILIYLLVENEAKRRLINNLFNSFQQLQSTMKSYISLQSIMLVLGVVFLCSISFGSCTEADMENFKENVPGRFLWKKYDAPGLMRFGKRIVQGYDRYDDSAPGLMRFGKRSYSRQLHDKFGDSDLRLRYVT